MTDKCTISLKKWRHFDKCKLKQSMAFCGQIAQYMIRMLLKKGCF
jgi:hypothetical protein